MLILEVPLNSATRSNLPRLQQIGIALTISVPKMYLKGAFIPLLFLFILFRQSLGLVRRKPVAFVRVLKKASNPDVRPQERTEVNIRTEVLSMDVDQEGVLTCR